MYLHRIFLSYGSITLSPSPHRSATSCHETTVCAKEWPSLGVFLSVAQLYPPGEVCGGLSCGTHFSLISLTQDDVRCHDWLSCMFSTGWGDVCDFPGASLGWFLLDLLCRYTFIGLACRPADIVSPLLWSLFSKDTNPGWGDWRRLGAYVWGAHGAVIDNNIGFSAHSHQNVILL